jgi:hypothetical protein
MRKPQNTFPNVSARNCGEAGEFHGQQHASLCHVPDVNYLKYIYTCFIQAFRSSTGQRFLLCQFFSNLRIIVRHVVLVYA